MRRCWLKGKTGDALHAVLCAAGCNLRWLLRAIARLGLKAFLRSPLCSPPTYSRTTYHALFASASRFGSSAGFKQPFAAHIEFCRAD